MRRILFLITYFLISSFSHFAYAQDAMKVLDTAAERLQRAGCVKIEYKASLFEGSAETAINTGTMWIQESKLKLEAEGITTWYDGKTRWCLVPQAGEVSIDEPTKKEMAAMNPYTFMGMYKKGFRMSVKETVLRGDAVYEVYLKARYPKMEVKEVYVDIRKSDYQPICIRVREDKDWQRVSILAFVGNLQLPEGFFSFPASEYPDILINDMR